MCFVMITTVEGCVSFHQLYRKNRMLETKIRNCRKKKKRKEQLISDSVLLFHRGKCITI